MKKIAVILSGCGVFDGAEINEAVLTLLHIAKAGASYACFAPNRNQMHTINHLNGEEMQESRNILTESARIARGDIRALDELNSNDYDGLILPGGFGAAKNLCDFAVNGPDAAVEKDIESVLLDFANANKPIGYMCIAPALIPFIHKSSASFTIGNDKETAAAIESIGGNHMDCPVSDVVVDKTNKIVSTPAYMLASSLVEADEGISKLVHNVLDMCK